MCVIFFYTNSNPAPGGYKLILASNRDEFFARSTLPAAKWANAAHVYGGIDLEPGREGGTWLAVSGQHGIFKVGALLNLTGEPKPRDAAVQNNNNILQTPKCVNGKLLNISPQQQSPAPTTPTISSTKTMNTSTVNHHLTSTTPTTNTDNNLLLLGRGMIVADYVSSGDVSDDIEHYNARLVADCTKYSAFNFVSIEIGAKNTPARIKLLSNVPPTLTDYNEQQCYGFGNSLPDAPFEKVRYGQQQFSDLVNAYNASARATQHEEQLISGLLDLLKCRKRHWPDAELDRRAPNWGEGLSSLNVHIPRYGYGSRTHTVIFIDAANKMRFHEETMLGDDPASKEWQSQTIEKQFEF